MPQLFDKVGKVDPVAGPEGQGEIWLSNDDPNWPWPEEGWLIYNFNIDGNVLKPEHKEFLDRFVIPFLQKERAHVRLAGTASRTGDKEYNRQLSIGRALRVQNYLKERGIPQYQLADLVGVGEDFSTSLSDEEARDRGVLIVIGQGFKPRPIRVRVPDDPIFVPPLIPPPLGGTPSSPATGKQFLANYGIGAGVSFGPGILGVGAGVGGALHGIWIVDPATGEYRKYFLPAAQASVGVGAPIPKTQIGPFSASGTLTFPSDKWTAFDCDLSSVDGFALQEAAIYGAGGLDSSVTTLYLPQLGCVVPLETGFMIGYQAGTDSGFLVPIEQGVFAPKSKP